MVEVNFTPSENFMDKQKYKDKTIEFSIEKVFQKENREGKMEWRLILNRTDEQCDDEDVRASNKLLVGLQDKFGNETENWINQKVQIKFSDFVQDGEIKGIQMELI